jgi:thiosulfate dehydrogenase
MKWFISLALVAGVLVNTSAFAEEIDSAIARGGQLYDKWYAVTKAETPKASHPLYPSDKAYAEKPDSNWRCKECHGWDYQGKNGAYASGKHATGIVGIDGMAGAETDAIIALLTGEAHGLGDHLSAEDARDLALFVNQGQVDMDQYIDRANKAPKGDAAQGAAYFNTICAGCHGRDGSLPKDMSKTLGAQMGNPWEVMHKILNGQPGEAMPALRALDRQIVVDIMAHLATLPKEK